VAISALTIYDMCKGIDPRMRIENIRLARKSGGKSGKLVFE
jgi:cyclic pyranopterin phosphate synthase